MTCGAAISPETTSVGGRSESQRSPREVVSFTVIGKPEPGGSKRGFVVNGRAVVSDANRKVKGWRTHVAAVAWEEYEGPVLRCPLEAEFRFYQPRPKSHYRTGKFAHLLKDSAPPYPTGRPDSLKLRRAVEDALSGVVYADDAQVVRGHDEKLYGEPARCEVTIWRLDGGDE